MRAVLGFVAVVLSLPASAWACDLYVAPEVDHQATLAELMEQVDGATPAPAAEPASGVLADVLAAVDEDSPPAVAEAAPEPAAEPL